MKNNPEEPGRRSIRLPDYDYSQPGAYFITLVTNRRECLFGEIKEDGRNGGREMHLNDAGKIIWEVWNSLPERYPPNTLGAAVVMPNHFHGIVIINESPIRAVREPSVGAIHELPLREIHQLPLREIPPRESPSRELTERGSSRQERRRMTIPLVVGYFKMNTAKRINDLLDSRGVPIWQRNYYEHIIRNDDEHNRIQLYIESNPVNWMEDNENPEKKP